jgi:site-specific DNA recombinase
VTRILEDTSAKGVYVHNRTKNIGNWKRELKPESEWGVVQVEPIVSEAVWDEVNRIVEEQRKAMVRPGKRPKHIFAGKLRCKCGRSMYVLSATPKYFCEQCRTRIPIIDLEAIFLDQLKSFFADPTRIAGHIRKANEAVSEKGSLLESSRAEIAKLKDQTARAYQLYIDQAIDSTRFKELTLPTEERLRQLQEEALRIQSDLDLCKVNSLSTETVVSEALDLQKRWPTLETEEKRRVVESIVERIVVDNDAKEIELTLSCIPTSEETTNSQQLL